MEYSTCLLFEIYFRKKYLAKRYAVPLHMDLYTAPPYVFFAFILNCVCVCASIQLIRYVKISFYSDSLIALEFEEDTIKYSLKYLQF